MVRHLDSGYSQPHLNEHESQQGPMRSKGMKEAKEAIEAHDATEMEKAEAAKRLEAMSSEEQIGGMNTADPTPAPEPSDELDDLE